MTSANAIGRLTIHLSGPFDPTAAHRLVGEVAPVTSHELVLDFRSVEGLVGHALPVLAHGLSGRFVRVLGLGEEGLHELRCCGLPV